MRHTSRRLSRTTSLTCCTEGDALAAWITFSAYRDGDEVVGQALALELTSDPLIELSYIFGANRANDGFWEKTLANLARSLGSTPPGDVLTGRIAT